MRTKFDTASYVRGLTIAGMAREQARAGAAEGRASAAPTDAVTLADLERLKSQIDAAAGRASADLQRFQLITLAGIIFLCATILLLHFSR